MLGLGDGPGVTISARRTMLVPLTIGDYLDRGAHVYSDRIAAVDEPGVPGSLGALTYADLAARARGLAVELDRRGVGPGERVAIVSPNASRFLVALFGVSAYGRVLVPVNFRLNADEIGYITSHSGASVVLIDPEIDERLDAVRAAHRIRLDGIDDAALFAPTDADPRHRPTDENALVSINYTSGTTARPKGVELTHRSCWLNAATLGWHAGVSDRDVYLHTLPMFHCNGWGVPYALTGMGARHVMLRKIDGEEILRRIEAHGVTLLCGAPAVVAAILAAAASRRAAGRDVPGRGSVRIIVAGAPPPSAVIARVEVELGWEFIQLYGLTETSPLLTVNRSRSEWDELGADERARRLSHAGPPAIGVRVRVDAQGEVVARSNHVFNGYWEQPEHTEQCLRDGWFHTGDGGYLEGPHVVISDRRKDVIITGGENVSSIEVEDVLYQHASVAEAAVIGVPDDRWGETVKALVVLRQGMSATEAEIVAHCRARMSHFKCPTTVEFRDALTRTATGKLQKFKLREPYWSGRDRQVS
jgi:fatty-acyl-CoA synthase